MKLILIAALLTASVFAQEPRFERDKLFVKVKKGSDLPHSKLIKSSKALFGQNYLVRTESALALEKEFKNHPQIASTERSYFAGKKKLPSVEKFKSDGPLLDFGAFNDPEAGKVWAFSDALDHGVSVDKAYLSPLNVKKKEIIVAVVDTGVDYNHEDLKDVMWINQNEIPGNGIDDDNNGYVDDVFGIDPLDDDTDPMASHAHGTHVSGTIAAAQNNNVGIAGVASSVKIMAIRTVPDRSDETDADVVESFLYAAEHGARLINCSFGKKHNEGGMIVNETIDHIGKNYGTLVIAAAGNDYRSDIDVNLKYPASFPSDYLMVVAATTKRGGLAWFSNVGLKNVDVAAPGSGVYSTTPGDGYGNMSGTSMAAPVTAGVAAELLSHFPELDAISLKKAVMDSVTSVDKFQDLMAAGGRVDLYQAIQHTLANYDSIMQNQDQRQRQRQQQQ
ncbi:MAG: S8 family peptidase [Bacteriovoracaceae bacterium]